MPDDVIVDEANELIRVKSVEGVPVEERRKVYGQNTRVKEKA